MPSQPDSIDSTPFLARSSRRGTERVTMEEVARYAQVSASSVSLFLRHPERVSAKLAPRIAAAIKDLNYVPNLLAGSLAAAHTRAVAVIVPSLANAFFAATVSAMQRVLEQNGYQLLLGDSGYDIRKEQELAQTFLAWSPAALVLTGLHHSAACRQLLTQARLPVAEMWELGPQPFDLQVGFSHRAVGETLARHLYLRGRRRLAFVGAKLGQDYRAAQRAQGCRDFLQQVDAEPLLVIDLPDAATPVGGAMALRELLAQHQQVDGICCSNDVLALGMLFEAQRLGIEIPRQLAVVGFGDLPYAQVAQPGLTTARPPSAAIGEKVIEHLLTQVAATEVHRQAVQLDLGFELIERASS
ncbi:LacI family DNA-binding transcriptional regulator [Neisseriaceae bacterium TC5R-5]|nr:LacI family DNA-binding transcriptional regulator [Neisseriaceae bacterium TC5R-5]